MKGDSGDAAQTCGTPSCHTYPRHCAYKIKKKTALTRKHFAKLQSSIYLPWAKTATNHGLCPYKKMELHLF